MEAQVASTIIERVPVDVARLPASNSHVQKLCHCKVAEPALPPDVGIFVLAAFLLCFNK